MNRKVTVVGGAGNVGATVARGVADKSLADVVVIDIADQKAAGVICRELLQGAEQVGQEKAAKAPRRADNSGDGADLFWKTLRHQLKYRAVAHAQKGHAQEQRQRAPGDRACVSA